MQPTPLDQRGQDIPDPAAAAKQDSPAEPPDAVKPLEAEVRVAAALMPATQPIWVDFLIHNRSDKPVDLGPVLDSEGVAIPLEMIVGVGDRPALTLAYEAESAAAVKTRPAWPEDAATRPLRIAAFGTVGTRVDLRVLHPNIRYQGSYRLDWRPLDGRAGTAAAALRIEPRKSVVLVTDHGKLTFKLHYEQAPHNVENFVDLVRQDFYTGKTFHRIVPGFAIQGGCPLGNGAGLRPDGRLVPAEFHAAAFEAGTLAMARKPDNPNSASCQFFVALARVPELDGQYTVVGRADDQESLRTLEKLAGLATDERDRPLRPLVIRSANLIDAPDALAAPRGAVP